MRIRWIRRFVARRGWAVAACLAAATIAGCGDSGPTRVPVRGKVTFDGGPPPGPGTVFFAPLKAAQGFPMRPANANFEQADGIFAVTSVQTGDGLVPGTYKVIVECWRRPPGATGEPGVSWVRANWNAPDLEIPPGTKGPVEFPIDVPTLK
ncbi:MAG: hypothetical protein JW809_07305 [Pirellulales bacterium]|nr:hypothetical protein [Pirellulales bacterium]